MHNNSRITQ